MQWKCGFRRFWFHQSGFFSMKSSVCYVITDVFHQKCILRIFVHICFEKAVSFLPGVLKIDSPAFGLQGALLIKPPKRSRTSLRMVVLVFAMACAVYICSVCLKQNIVRTRTNLLNVELNQKDCSDKNIDRSLTPYLHFPKPTTFSR